MIVLGISGLYHDSAAAIIKDGEILFAAQEERFTRIKHDNNLPINAIQACLDYANIQIFEVDKVVYYDQPLLTLDRFVKNCFALGDEAEYLLQNNFIDVVGSRLMVDSNLRKHFGILGKDDELLTLEHHLSHAASAFYPSPFDDAAILTIDGVGEWATTTLGYGSGNAINIIKEVDYPHSLGLLYSAFTAFCGFKVNFGDYKFMGLAPYGKPVYYDVVKNEIINLKEDGSFRLNLSYFSFYKDKFMTNDKFAELFGGAPRSPESRITQREMDIAASVQQLTEEIIIALAKNARDLTKSKNLVMAGGVALNCVANGKLLKSELFDHIWIQPAAGDAGGAVGCALYTYYNSGAKRTVFEGKDTQNGSFLGSEFSDDAIKSFLDKKGYPYACKDSSDDLCEEIGDALSKGKVVGWFQGRMEFGPRALGNRSILGNPQLEEMQSKLNLKIKYRESFRPFAPAVLRDRVGDYFEMNSDSPYMLLVANVKEDLQESFDKDQAMEQYKGDMLPIVNMKRSSIPAVTHVDYSARIQTVSQENGRFYQLLKTFEKETGCAVLINTSFNVRGEPIVCTPMDAYRCFMRTEMDILVLGNCILRKEEQGEWKEEGDWRDEFTLD